MDESSGKSEFRVVDKRRFNTEGDERGEATDELKQSSAPSEKGAATGVAASGEATARPASQEFVGEASSDFGAPDTIDFASFVVSMGTQALMALGEMPNPETHTASVNMDAAKQMIDILGLLEVKTKGNLTIEEAHLLEEVLASLRLMFARKVR